MIYVIDTFPAYCPACARTPASTPNARTLFFAGVPQKCKCGATFAHLPLAYYTAILGQEHVGEDPK
jgi:hypothetical protein